MRTAIKWSVVIVAALLIAGIPTRLGSYEIVVGIPFTRLRSQEVITVGDITFGEQAPSFSVLFLLSDFGLSLVVLAGGARLFRARHT